jgi:hypothetical protein
VSSVSIAASPSRAGEQRQHRCIELLARRYSPGFSVV